MSAHSKTYQTVEDLESSRLRRSLTAAVAGLACLIWAPGLSAQAQGGAEVDPQAGVFAEIVEVSVINVDVVVTDNSGVPVAGLGEEDFVLEVDGKPVEISNFYAEAGGRVQETVGSLTPSDSSFRPVEESQEASSRTGYVVVLIDHTRLKQNNRRRAFGAVREALDKLGREDLVAVVGIEGGLVFYSDFLYDRQAVGRILDDVSAVARRTDISESERRQIFGELARGMSGGIQGRASLAEEDAIISRIRAYASEQYASGVESLRLIETVVGSMSGIPGRKTLLYVGEGIPTRPGEGLYQEWINRFGGGSPDAEIGLPRFDFNTDYVRAVGRFDLERPMQQLATTANRAGVTLYAIDAEESHSKIIRSALTEQGATAHALAVIDENYREPLEYAAKATGGRLLLSSGRLEQQLTELVDDFDTFYSLGFEAPSDWEAGSDHNVEVRVRGKGFRVRHRNAVRLPGPDEREAAATLAALRYQTVSNPLGIRASVGQALPRSDGTAAVEIRLELPIEKLSFLPRGEAQVAAVNIYVSTKDAKGDATRVQKIPFHLPPVPNEVMEKLASEAATYPLPVVLRPGDTQVAIGVRDNVSGAFSAIRLDVSAVAPAG